MLNSEDIRKLKETQENGEIAKRKLVEYDFLEKRLLHLEHCIADIAAFDCYEITVHVGPNHNVGFDVSDRVYGKSMMEQIMLNEISLIKIKIGEFK